MQKYRCYYTNDFRDDYDAMAKPDEYGDWYRVEDVDARIADLEKLADRSEKAYRNRAAPLIETINQQQARIADLERENANLGAVAIAASERMKELEARNERLERVNSAAIRYYVNYMQDEAHDPLCCSKEQHEDALNLHEALRDAPSEKAKELADAIGDMHRSLMEPVTK